MSTARPLRYATLLTVIVTVTGSGSVCGGEPGEAAAVEVPRAWARPTPPGAVDGAVHMTVRAVAHDTLVAGDTSPLALEFDVGPDLTVSVEARDDAP